MPGKEESVGDDLVTLLDEQGNEHDFIIEDIFECQEKRYAVLVPVEQPEQSDEDENEDLEAYIFRIELSEGEEVLVEVEDEEEWERVASCWEILTQDQELDVEKDLN